MALSRRLLDANEQTHVEINCQAKERLDALSMLIGHGINRVEYHAKGLLVAVGLAKR